MTAVEIPISNSWEGRKESPDGLAPYTYTKVDNYYGVISVGFVSNKSPWRIARGCWHVASLDALPANANVTKVRVKYSIPVGGAGGANFLMCWRPYNNDGQGLPCDDTGETFFDRCATGTVYVEDSGPRTEGEKWVTLGDGESAQACIDVENAKQAVNRFSLGMQEKNDDDLSCDISMIGARLEITYELPVVAGYSYGDGLVCVQVAG